MEEVTTDGPNRRPTPETDQVLALTDAGTPNRGPTPAMNQELAATDASATAAPNAAAPNRRPTPAMDQELATADQDGEDFIDTYGPTIIRHFRKEFLERQFGFNKPPNLLSKKMIVLLLLIVAAFISLLAILVSWIKNIRSITFDFELLHNLSLDEEDHPAEVLESHRPKLSLVHNHIIIEVVVFVVIVPIAFLASILGSSTDSFLVEIIYIIKLSAAVLFYIGFRSAKVEDFSNERRDFFTHAIFGYLTVAIFTGYFVYSTLQILGRCAPRIFQIRVLGDILQQLFKSKEFIGPIDILVSVMSAFSIITGMVSYLNYRREDDYMHQYIEVYNRQISKQEQDYVKAATFLSLFLCGTIVTAVRHKHFTIFHRKNMSYDVFHKYFYQFWKNAKPSEVGDKSGMPKVTTPVRMY